MTLARLKGTELDLIKTGFSMFFLDQHRIFIENTKYGLHSSIN